MDAAQGRREALCTHRPTGPELDTRRFLVIEHKAYDSALEDIRTRRRGRFSAGIEQLPETTRKLRVGRFSEGSEQRRETVRRLHVGHFGEGTEQLPTTKRKLRRGSFADGFDYSQSARE
jgi:hypothetical protein